jgi:hypothetical protein
MKVAKRLWACAWWLSVMGTAACDGSGGGADGGSGGASDGGSGGASGGASGGGAGGGSITDQCSKESACHATVLFPGDCWSLGAPTGVQHEDSARCALEHLRDGTVALVTIDQTSTSVYGPGYCGTKLDIHVAADRTAILVETTYYDLSETPSISSAELKAPDYYQQCLDDGPTAYASCLADALASVGGPATCE